MALNEQRVSHILSAMISYAKISRYKIGRIFYYFFEDFTAIQTAKITRLNRNTTNLWYNHFRQAIVPISINQTQKLTEFEVDESYFSVKRVR